MDPKTLELLRVLQSGAHDSASFAGIRALLSTQRPRLAAADDRATLADISELLEVWAESAPAPMAAAALQEAAQIAEVDLQQAERAVQLYSQCLERDPSALDTLTKIEPLLMSRGEHERFETLLASQARALVGRDGVDAALPASLFRRLGDLRAKRNELDAAIEAYEQVLELDAEPDILRVLADAYSQRGGPADATQAADLYYTLGDVSGAADGVQWVERALDQVPSHDEALDLLESYVPAELHAERLPKRWQAYIDASSNEASTDKRRMLLARALAARGDTRDALICLGPLIDRSDPDAIALQSECLASLRAEEARARDSHTNGTAHVAGNGVAAAYKPPTLVGFRVPPADKPAATEPVTETRPKPEPAVVAEPPKRARAARSGETLVGFRVPAEFEERPSETAPEAEAAQEPKAVSVVTLRQDAEPAPQVAPARAAGEARAKAGGSAGVSSTAKSTAVPLAKIQTRATIKGGFGGAVATPRVTAPAPSKAPAGPAAAAAALKAAAVARTSSAPSTPSTPSKAPAAAPEALAKAAALRAALRDTMPAALAHMPMPATAPRPLSQPPSLLKAQRSLAASQASAATVPALDAASAGAPVSIAPAAALPIPSSVPAFDDASPFATRPTGSNQRWWIASALGLLALGGVLALLFRPSPHPTPAPLASRGESQAPLPAPVIAASAAAPTAVAAPAPSTNTAAAADAPTAAATPTAPTTGATEAKAAAPAATPTKEAPTRPGKRSAQPEVKAVANQVRVHGNGVSAKEVVAALDDSLAKIERCYGRTLEQDARAQGQITFAWTIDKAGRAAKVHKVKATIKDAALQRCAGDAIEKTRFPKPKKHSVQVTAPLDFHKA